ncbi:hypothetical protein CL622_05250 [archaeon]|nr:hypothetical protein [archaeon]|tara:strand:- start:239 stop:784 length:546 start_codon:yes stop_codon:yes gene_type:complete
MYTKVKQIKGIEYLYLVKQTYDKRHKKTRQKTVKYLGRIVSLSKKREIDLNRHIPSIKSFIESNSLQTIFQKLIQYELFNHGFRLDNKLGELKDNHYRITPRCRMFKQINSGAKVCFEINQGFLTGHSIDRLCEPLPVLESDLACGEFLAKRYGAEGLDISPELFILLFKRVLKQGLLKTG